jgi:hypothetical protein
MSVVSYRGAAIGVACLLVTPACLPSARFSRTANCGITRSNPMSGPQTVCGRKINTRRPEIR